MRYLLLVIIAVCSCSQVSDQSEDVTVHESSLDSVLPVTDSSIIEETSINCLEILRSIDKEKLTSMCAEKSTAGFESILDDGRKLGSYMLFFRNSLGTIEELGALYVAYEKTPWLRFNEEEEWRSLLVKSDTLKINEYLYVGQNIDSIR